MKKPLIGIGADFVQANGRERVTHNANYVEAVIRAGGVPLLVPPQAENLEAIAGILDGILLAGGRDLDPQLYGEEPHPKVELLDARRQTAELALARIGRQRGIPTLGICLGSQVINVAAGGNLIQHVESHEECRHPVAVAAGSCLASIIGAGVHDVNSRHHQVADRPGAGLRVSATAADGIIEGLEDPEHPFYLGVQWHPEDMPGEASAEKLFAAFVEAARAYAAERDGESPLHLATAAE